MTETDKNPLIKKESKWIVLACCIAMVFTALGFCSGIKSLYLPAITKALDLKRSLFSINDSFRYIATAVVNLFFGAMLYRLGVKKLIAMGFCSLIISCLLYTFAKSIFLFYLGGCFLGIGLAWTTTTMVSYVIKAWFPQNTGTFIGMVLASNGLGSVVATQLLSPVIYAEGSSFGYKNAYMITTLLLVIVAVLVLVFMKELPADSQFIQKSPTVKEKGTPQKTRFFTPTICMASVCVFVTGMCLQSVNSIAAAHMMDVGMTAKYAALVMTVFSVALTLFKFLVGFFYDRFGLRIVMLICHLTAVVNIFIFANLTNSPSGQFMAMLFGIFIALAMPLETIGVTLIAAELSNPDTYAKALGLFVSACTVGFAVGSPVTNLFYDHSGTYRTILLIFSGSMLAVAICFQRIFQIHKTKENQYGIDLRHS